MVGPPNWADDSIGGSARKSKKRSPSKPTLRMAKVMGCKFEPKQIAGNANCSAPQSCPMCCGPIDEDGMTLAGSGRPDGGSAF
jgi:hypothetical protein